RIVNAAVQPAVLAIVAGLIAGLVLSVGLSKVVAQWSIGNLNDPIVLVAISLVLFVVTMMSAAIPANRAASIQPADALRIDWANSPRQVQRQHRDNAEGAVRSVELDRRYETVLRIGHLQHFSRLCRRRVSTRRSAGLKAGRYMSVKNAVASSSRTFQECEVE